MNPSVQRLCLIASAAALAAGLSACNRNDERTAGQQLDAAIAKTEQAAQDAQARAAEAGQDLRDAAQKAAADARAAASDVREEVSAASERVAEAASDAAITASVNARLARDPDLSALSIKVQTKDGHVTLSGPAPSELARTRAGTLTREVSGVTAVDNQLVLQPG
ncbi:MAG: BON domain-containing protein [Pseudomonadota bacterium]|nr:BON domain-containing protein [Pseudomonadota bacterium]